VEKEKDIVVKDGVQEIVEKEKDIVEKEKDGVQDIVEKEKDIVEKDGVQEIVEKEKEIVEKEKEIVEKEKEIVEKHKINEDSPNLEIKVIKNDEKEIITVSKNDSDDETVDEFFNDITRIMEGKGQTVDKNPKKYTLFDDAIMEE